MRQLSEHTFSESPDIETSSEDYARRFSGKVGAWFLKVQEVATLRMLAPYPDANVLEVGGGHGQITGPMVSHGYKVTVLGSRGSSQRSIQELVEKDLCLFQVGNLLDLPYPDRSFDIVISYRLLPHVVQWKRLLSELTRVADKAVVIDYPTTRSLNYIAPLLFRFKKQLEGNTRPFTCFKEKELIEEFGSLGFTKAGQFPEFFIPMVLHRVVKSPGLSSGMEQVCRMLGLTNWLGSPVIMKLARATN
jgi:hypothetical protein